MATAKPIFNYFNEINLDFIKIRHFDKSAKPLNAINAFNNSSKTKFMNIDYIHNGHATFTLNGETIQVKAGDYYFRPASAFEHFDYIEVSDDFEIYHLIFTFDSAENYLHLYNEVKVYQDEDLSYLKQIQKLHNTYQSIPQNRDHSQSQLLFESILTDIFLSNVKEHF